MSRIGKQPVQLPQNVKAVLDGHTIRIEGPKGKLELAIEPVIDVKVADQQVLCSLKDATAPDARAKFGLTRSLLANMVRGVAQGFTRELEVIGVGYRAAVKGNQLEMALGFSHPVLFPIPEGIMVTVEKQTKITISGADKHLVGQTAAEIRRYRVPEPYKGKGIKYANETVRRKAGKAAGAGAAAST
ncbi:MAG TPA: 50S ribosomal protein L6 [Bdellovibrionota bacterium]|nr:50S ribosomal protein L6 [Bdellovibrionota bacterium]